MGRTLLIGNPRTTWREWLKAHRGKRDLLCLDPADPQQGVPGRLSLLHGEHPLQTRFYGALDPQRAPHVLLAALADFLPKLGEDGIVQLFPYRPGPLLRQLTMLAAELVRPQTVLVSCGTELEPSGFPLPFEEVSLPEALTGPVQHAQRKAQWLRLIEDCEHHEIDLRSVVLEGSRLGSGTLLTSQEREHAGIEGAVRAERCGNVLFVVAGYDPEESEITRALDATGSSRAIFADPSVYDNLLCAFVRADGEEIGMGLIQHIDWSREVAEVLGTAVAPAPVRTFRMGALKVDKDGREVGELKPWQA